MWGKRYWFWEARGEESKICNLQSWCCIWYTEPNMRYEQHVNVSELKRSCLDHTVSNTRYYYSPSAAVAAWSCGGPAGSVLPAFSSARHRLSYWSGRIDAVTLYITAFGRICATQRTLWLSHPYKLSSICKDVTLPCTLSGNGPIRGHLKALWHLLLFLA
jgi:hypothetical protein